MRVTRSFLALAALSVATTAQATPKLQGSYGDWSVFTRYEGAQQLCYVLAKAATKSPSNVKHGDIYFMVANWKSGAASEQPSFMADFSLQAGSPPKIKVGSASYPMYVSQNEAFVADNGNERALLGKMRAGSTMKIDAVSARGTRVNYSFSLNGITAALKKSKDSCA